MYSTFTRGANVDTDLESERERHAQANKQMQKL